MFRRLLPASTCSELLPPASHLCLGPSRAKLSCTAGSRGRAASPHPSVQGSCVGRKAWEEQNGSRKAQLIGQAALFIHSFVESFLCDQQCCGCRQFAINKQSGHLCGVSVLGLVPFTQKTPLSLLPLPDTTLVQGWALRVEFFMLRSLQLGSLASPNSFYSRWVREKQKISLNNQKKKKKSVQEKNKTNQIWCVHSVKIVKSESCL